MQGLKRLFGGISEVLHERTSPQEAFDEARELAAGQSPRKVVLVRPDLSLLALACPVAETLPRELLQQIQRLVPPSVKRNVAVVTSTAFAGPGSKADVGSLAWVEAGKEIPFFGLLNGIGCVGHTVWMFDPQSDMAAASTDADILIIDSAVASQVPEEKLAAARKVMRASFILIHDRATYQLKPVAPSQQDVVAHWPVTFGKARAATRQGNARRLVMVRPDQSMLCLPCIPLQSMSSDQLSQVHRLIPAGVERNVVAIAPTALECDPAELAASPTTAHLRAAGKAIPFFGLLLNLASAGNSLWIFDGQPEAIAAGCSQADLLFIDSALAGKLTTRHLDEAAQAMRSANIAVYNRETRQIALLRHVGPTKEKLEFRD